MPRLRGTSGSIGSGPSVNSLRVEVDVDGVRVLVACGDGRQQVSWLAQQATVRYASTTKGQAGLLEGRSPVIIQELLTASGALISKEDIVRDVIDNGDVLTAEVAYPELSSVDEYSLESSPDATHSQACMAFGSGAGLDAYGHNARVFDLAFSPTNSGMLATASDDCTAKVWTYNAERSQYLQAASFHGHSDSVMCITWDPSGTLIATGSADSSVQLWRPNDDAGIPEAASQSNKQVAGYGVKPVGELTDHPEEVYAAEFSEGGSGQHMLTASAWSPYLWDIQTCQLLGEGAPMAAPDQSATGRLPERWQAGHIFCARKMPGGGPLVAASCSDGTLRMWRLKDGHRELVPHAVAQLHTRAMGSSCAWHPEGHQVASLAIDGSLAVVDTRMGGRVCWAVNVGRPLYGCCYLPGFPHTIAVCGSGRDITLLSIEGAKPQPYQPANTVDHKDEAPVVISTEDIRWRRIAAENAGGSQRNSVNIVTAPAASTRSPQRQSLDGQRIANAACCVPSTLLRSSSTALGQRSLLCIAASADGTSLAASGEAAVLDSLPSARASRGRGFGLDGPRQVEQPSHKQSKRATVEIWRCPP